MIKNKHPEVPDSVCKECWECWENQCRFGQDPTSKEEAAHRRQHKKGTRLPCVEYLFGWAFPKRQFPDEMDVKTLLLLVGVVVLILLLARFVG